MSAEEHSQDISPASRVSAEVVDQRQPSYSWVVMGQLWGMDLMNVIVFSSIGVLIPYWREEMGVTPLQAGILGAAGFLGFGVMALPASIWLTRYNPRLVTLVTTALMAVMALGQALAPTVLLLIVTRFFFVLVSVCRIQMQVIFIQQWFQPRLYAMINSLDFGNRSLGQTLGVAAIPPLIGLLGSWRNSYIAVAIALAVLSIVWVFFGRERRRTQQEGGPPPQVGSPAGVLRRHKVLWVIAGCQIGAAVVFASFLTFYPTYAIDSMGISRTVAGLTMGLFSVGAMVGSLAAGPLSQMIGRRKPFIWAPGLVLPVCYIALLQVDSVTYAMMLLFLAGVCAMAVPPIIATIPLDMRLPPREVAVAIGLTRTLFPFSATIGPLVVGAIAGITGSLFTGLLIVSPMAITLFIGGKLMPETGSKGGWPPRSKGSH